MAMDAKELRPLMAAAKKGPIPFGFAPGAKDEDHAMVMHRTKAPEALGKAAKSDADADKFACGMAKIEGKELLLTCSRVVSNIAKKVKKGLKLAKINLNVVILDEKGNRLEEDIEDLKDAFGDEEEGGAIPAAPPPPGTAAKPAPGAAPAPGAVPPAPPPPPGTAARPAPGATPAPGAIPPAPPPPPGTAAKPAPDAAPAPGAIPPAPPPPPGTDPRLAALGQALRTVAARVGELPASPARNALAEAVKIVGGQIAKAEVEAAVSGLKRIQGALAAASGAAPGAEIPPGAPPAPDTAGRDWEKARERIEPLVQQMLSEGRGDVSKIRAVWAFATEKADADDFASAMKAVPGLVQLLKAASAAGKTAAEEEIPADVVAFVKSRLGWIRTRGSLRGELSKLRDAIVSACQGIEEFADIATVSQGLFDHIAGLDDRLEKVLETLVQTPDGPEREKLKQQARGIVGEYRGTLDSDFFKDVDTANGFASVAVRGPAMASLQEVADALA